MGIFNNGKYGDKYSNNSENSFLYVVAIVSLIAIATIGVIVALVTKLMWLLVFFLPPVILLNLSIWALLASLFLKKHKPPFWALSIAGGLYMLLDMAMVWTSGQFYLGVSSNPIVFNAIVYLNSISVAMSIYFLASKFYRNKKDNIQFRVGIPAVSFLAAFTVVMSYQYLISDNMQATLKELKETQEVPSIIQEEPLSEPTPNDSL